MGGKPNTRAETVPVCLLFSILLLPVPSAMGTLRAYLSRAASPAETRRLDAFLMTLRRAFCAPSCLPCILLLVSLPFAIRPFSFTAAQAAFRIAAQSLTRNPPVKFPPFLLLCSVKPRLSGSPPVSARLVAAAFFVRSHSLFFFLTRLTSHPVTELAYLHF